MARKRKAPVAYKLTIGRSSIVLTVDDFDKFEKDKSVNAMLKRDIYLYDVVDYAPIYDAAGVKFSDEAKFKAFKKLIPAEVKKAIKREKQHEARIKKEEKKRLADEKKRISPIAKKYPLPEDVTVDDLICSYDYDSRLEYNDPIIDQLKDVAAGWRSFEIWYVERFGWVVPSLAINQSEKHGSYRTYATIIKSGEFCRVGHGPHVLARFTVYINKKNVKRVLKRYLSILTEGAQKAHNCRDRISTRRARSKTSLWGF